MPCALPNGGRRPPSPGRFGATSDTVRSVRVASAAGTCGASLSRSGSVVASATLPTRLETRTKESNVGASRRAVRDSQAK